MKPNLTPFLCAAAGALALATTAAQANLLVNGGLESSFAGNLQQVAAGASANGWTASGNNIEFVRVGHSASGDSIASAFDGLWFVDLNGNQGAGAISQSLATVVGQRYNVNFWMSGNPGPNGANIAGGPKTADLLWNGVTVGSFSYAHQAGDRWSNLRWEARAALVTGTGGTDTLTFRSTSTLHPAAGAFIDGVSVSAVPEPATWALMFGGLLTAAGVARRRQAW